MSHSMKKLLFQSSPRNTAKHSFQVIHVHRTPFLSTPNGARAVFLASARGLKTRPTHLTRGDLGQPEHHTRFFPNQVDRDFPGDPSRGTPQEYSLRVGHAIETIREELPRIFKNGLCDTSIYSPSIRLTESTHTNASLQGKSLYLTLAGAVRWSFRAWFRNLELEIQSIRVNDRGGRGLTGFDFNGNGSNDSSSSSSSDGPDGPGAVHMIPSSRLLMSNKTTTAQKDNLTAPWTKHAIKDGAIVRSKGRRIDSASGGDTSNEQEIMARVPSTSVTVRWKLTGTVRSSIVLTSRGPTSPPPTSYSGIFVYEFDDMGLIDEHRIENIMPTPSPEAIQRAIACSSTAATTTTTSNLTVSLSSSASATAAGLSAAKTAAATAASTSVLASVGYADPSPGSDTIGTKRGGGGLGSLVSGPPSAINTSGSAPAPAAGGSVMHGSSRVTDAKQHEESHGKAVHTRDTKSFDYIAKTMFAGGIAGITAKTAIAPLDPFQEGFGSTWTGVFKAAREIQRTNGVRGLFQGNSATVLRIFPYAAIKFMAYEQYRSILMPTRRDETPYKKLVAGSLAGVTSVFFTYPLDLIRVRLAYETRATPYMTLVRKIYSERASSGGLRVANFYRGFLTSVVGMIPYAGVSFFTHDVMQEFCRRHLPWTLKPKQKRGLPDANGDYSRPELRTVAELTCGGIAGAVSQTASYPLEVVRRKMQVAGALDPKHYVGMLETAKQLYIAKGVRGFFVGLSIGYLKVTPMVAISFTVYERMKVLLDIN
ncbi:hypothetical protein BGW42_006493 [Actinomortierella wolfii]|nr:hypothetical protein BGW42_006493 [Actinomortierella wolfii]